MQSLSYTTFMEKLPTYVKFNYYLASLSVIQLFLMISVLPSQLLCRQGTDILI